MIQIRIIGGWQRGKEEQYRRLLKWIDNNKDVAKWEHPCTSATWIDNIVYPTNLEVASEEDVLVCKLLFPELM